LENFRLEVQEIATDALPELPTKGSLDISAVKESEFFFS
jgi:DNA-directed RNA polymerase